MSTASLTNSWLEMLSVRSSGMAATGGSTSPSKTSLLFNFQNMKDLALSSNFLSCQSLTGLGIQLIHALFGWDKQDYAFLRKRIVFIMTMVAHNHGIGRNAMMLHPAALRAAKPGAFHSIYHLRTILSLFSFHEHMRMIHLSFNECSGNVREQCT